MGHFLYEHSFIRTLIILYVTKFIWGIVYMATKFIRALVYTVTKFMQTLLFIHNKICTGHYIYRHFLYNSKIIQCLQGEKAVLWGEDNSNSWMSCCCCPTGLYTWTERMAAPTGRKGRPLIVHENWSQYASFMSEEKLESRCSINNSIERYYLTTRGECWSQSCCHINY